MSESDPDQEEGPAASVSVENNRRPSDLEILQEQLPDRDEYDILSVLEEQEPHHMGRLNAYLDLFDQELGDDMIQTVEQSIVATHRARIAVDARGRNDVKDMIISALGNVTESDNVSRLKEYLNIDDSQ